jgi:hypothetical protein
MGIMRVMRQNQVRSEGLRKPMQGFLRRSALVRQIAVSELEKMQSARRVSEQPLYRGPTFCGALFVAAKDYAVEAGIAAFLGNANQRAAAAYLDIIAVCAEA